MSGKGSGTYRNEFKHDGGDVFVTDDMKHVYWETGYVIIRGLFDKEEMEQIKKSLEAYSDTMKEHAYKIPDHEGRSPDFMLWNYPGDDVLGMVTRCEKMASTSEQLMGGDEMYHYHSKLVMKAPNIGGRFEWHQDYGYWYKNLMLTDEANTAFVALDPCTKANGCLQVLVGSHKAGRIDHGFTGGQQGADPERLEHLKAVYDLAYMELQPGDVAFFHSNLLHASGPNNSDVRRWALLSAYVKRKNSPVKEHHCALYNPLRKVPNTAIKSCSVYCDPEGMDFINPVKDHTVHATDIPTEA